MNNYVISNYFYGIFPSVYGGTLILNVISRIASSVLFQGAIIFLILFLSAYSMHSLVSVFTESRGARLYAGMLYMLNPYTYIRLLVGHWFILFAYALLPLALKAFLEYLEKGGRKSGIKLVLLTSLVAINSHTLVIALLIYGILLLFHLSHHRSADAIKRALYALPCFLILNTYWLLPALVSVNESLVRGISTQDLVVFSPVVESISSLFTIASMYGFWRPGYLYAKDFLPGWQLLFLALLFLSVYGLVLGLRDTSRRLYAGSFFAIWAAGLILASGAISPFPGLFELLFEKVPLAKGMRDTHKFVTMLALSYAYLGALGFEGVQKSLRSMRTKRLALLLLLLPPLYSFTFFNGFAGQVAPADFPADWYEVNEFLNTQPGEFRVLFLPWHQYMNFHWVPNRDKRIANPAPYFFDRQVISGKNIEAGPIYRQVYSPEQVYIDHLVERGEEIRNLGELLSVLNVRYILLTKEADYKNYFFLFNQSDLELVMETDNFYVFKNNAYVSKIFSVSSKVCVSNMSEFIELSRKIDIRRTLVVVGENCSGDIRQEGFKELNYTKASPVKYVINDEPLKYIVLAEEYHRSWKLSGKEPMKAYGVVNAWKAEKGDTVIRFERFYRVNLPAYIVSLLAFVILLAILVFL